MRGRIVPCTQLVVFVKSNFQTLSNIRRVNERLNKYTQSRCSTLFDWNGGPLLHARASPLLRLPARPVTALARRRRAGATKSGKVHRLAPSKRSRARPMSHAHCAAPESALRATHTCATHVASILASWLFSYPLMTREHARARRRLMEPLSMIDSWGDVRRCCGGSLRQRGLPLANRREAIQPQCARPLHLFRQRFRRPHPRAPPSRRHA